jgi:hypothetical protein
MYCGIPAEAVPAIVSLLESAKKDYPEYPNMHLEILVHEYNFVEEEVTFDMYAWPDASKKDSIIFTQMYAWLDDEKRWYTA